MRCQWLALSSVAHGVATKHFPGRQRNGASSLLAASRWVVLPCMSVAMCTSSAKRLTVQLLHMCTGRRRGKWRGTGAPGACQLHDASLVAACRPLLSECPFVSAAQKDRLPLSPLALELLFAALIDCHTALGMMLPRLNPFCPVQSAGHMVRNGLALVATRLVGDCALLSRS